MLVHALKTLAVVALTAPPFFILLTGCSFGSPLPSRSSAIFGNIEKGRECAATSDLAEGVDIARQDETGFWIGRTGDYGLDYSPAAVAACNGMPQKVLFHGPFPEGSTFCVGAGSVGSTYPDITTAVQKKCEEANLTEPDGTPYRCDFVAWPAHRANMEFPNGCDSSGTPLTSFQDPRKLPPFNPVTWTGTVNVVTEGNSVRKMSLTPGYDAGASANRLLDTNFHGAFEFLASETNLERTAGFAKEEDNDPSDSDILYGVVLRDDGTLHVQHDHITLATSPYVSGDRIRIVVALDKIIYYRNQTLIHAAAVTLPEKLRATVALRDFKATINNAFITF